MPAPHNPSPDADFDEDGLTGAQETELGTSDELQDSDADGVPDTLDAVPYDPAFDIPLTPLGKFVPLDLGVCSQPSSLLTAKDGSCVFLQVVDPAGNIVNHDGHPVGSTFRYVCYTLTHGTKIVAATLPGSLGDGAGNSRWSPQAVGHGGRLLATGQAFSNNGTLLSSVAFAFDPFVGLTGTVVQVFDPVTVDGFWNDNVITELAFGPGNVVQALMMLSVHRGSLPNDVWAEVNGTSYGTPDRWGFNSAWRAALVKYDINNGSTIGEVIKWTNPISYPGNTESAPLNEFLKTSANQLWTKLEEICYPNAIVQNRVNANSATWVMKFTDGFFRTAYYNLDLPGRYRWQRKMLLADGRQVIVDHGRNYSFNDTPFWIQDISEVPAATEDNPNPIPWLAGTHYKLASVHQGNEFPSLLNPWGELPHPAEDPEPLSDPYERIDADGAAIFCKAPGESTPKWHAIYKNGKNGRIAANRIKWIGALNSKGQALVSENADWNEPIKLWANGRTWNFIEDGLLPESFEDDWTFFEPCNITEDGAILGAAVGSDEATHVLSLAPIEFRTRPTNDHGEPIADQITNITTTGHSELAPRVEFTLEIVSSSSVKLKGIIRDPILNNVPQSAGQDHSEVFIYVNSELTSTVALVHHTSEYEPDGLAQRRFEARIPDTVLDIEFGGVVHIAVETAPNLVGKVGRAEGYVGLGQEISFDGTPVTQWRISIIGNHSLESLDEIALLCPFSPNPIQLIEETPDSNSFVSEAEGFRVELTQGVILNSGMTSFEATVFWHDYAGTTSSFTALFLPQAGGFQASLTIDALNAQSYQLRRVAESSPTTLGSLELKLEGLPWALLNETDFLSDVYTGIDQQGHDVKVVLDDPLTGTQVDVLFTSGHSNLGPVNTFAKFTGVTGSPGTYQTSLRKWHQGLGFTKTYFVDEMEGGQSEHAADDHPLAIVFPRSDTDIRFRFKNTSVILECGPDFYLTTSQIGFHLVGHLLRNEDTEATEFVFWDVAASVLRKVVVADKIELEVLDAGNSKIAEAQLDVMSLVWLNASGLEDHHGPLTVPLDFLLRALDTNDFNLPEASLGKVRIVGASNNTKLTFQSSDVPEDAFTLLGPSFSLPPDGKFARLVQVAADTFESEDFLVTYQSSPDQDVLSEADWHRLKNAGILAVHNIKPNATVAWWNVKNQYADAKRRYRYQGRQDHHIFNIWRAFQGVDSKYKVANEIIFGNGGINLVHAGDVGGIVQDVVSVLQGGMLCDALTIAVKEENHKKTMNQMTQHWRNLLGPLINALLPDPKVRAGQIMTFRRNAIEFMWRMVNQGNAGFHDPTFVNLEPWVKGEFDLTFLRPHYRTIGKFNKPGFEKIIETMRQPGSTVALFFVLDSFDGMPDPTGSSTKDKRWKKIFGDLVIRKGKEGASELAGEFVLKRFKFLTILAAAWPLLQANPAQAMADVYGWDVDYCQEIIDNIKVGNVNLWNPNEFVDVAKFTNGSQLVLNERISIIEKDLQKPLLVGKVQHGSVLRIQQTEIPGTYKVFVALDETSGISLTDIIPFSDLIVPDKLEDYLKLTPTSDFILDKRPEYRPNVVPGQWFEQ